MTVDGKKLLGRKNDHPKPCPPTTPTIPLNNDTKTQKFAITIIIKKPADNVKMARTFTYIIFILTT